MDEAISEATEVLHITEPQTRKIPSKAWRECIKKVWEVDPLECPHCGAEMKIISFIDEPILIRRILEHLNLWPQRIPKGLPPPTEREKVFTETIICEEFDGGWCPSDDPDVALP
jgi:transposase